MEAAGRTHVVQGASDLTPGLDQIVQDDTVQVTLINSVLGWLRTYVVTPLRESKVMASRAFQITVLCLGVLFVVAGLVLTFVLQAELGKNAFLFLIPAVLGLVKIMTSSVFTESPCTVEKLRLCKRFLGMAEDVFDDGIINNSNVVFRTDT